MMQGTDSILRICPLSDKELIDKILVFVEEYTRPKRVGRADLYSYQKLFARRIIESVMLAEGDTITALFARQSGKTQTVADVAISLCVILPVLAREFPDDMRLKAFSAGFWVGIFAPIMDQAGISFSRMRSVASSDEGEAILRDPEINIELTTDRGDEIGFSTGSVVRAKSASPDTQIEGKTYHLVLVDEAQKVLRSKVEKEIMPMLAATAGTMVKIGTAWESRGGFHTDIQYNIENYARGGRRNHFEFDYKMVIAEKREAHRRDGNPFHLNYEKYVEKQIRRLGGIDNEEFKMNFRLLWADSRIIAIKTSVLLAGRDASREMDILRLPRDGRSLVAGLDVAKSNDSTVLTLMDIDLGNPIVDISKYGTPHDKIGSLQDESEQNYFYVKYIVGWLELQGTFEGDTGQYQQVLDYLARFPPLAMLLCDATGMGDPVYERFTVLLPEVDVQPFKYSTPSNSDLYKYYLQEWSARRIRYPAGSVAQEHPFFLKFETQHMDLDKIPVGNYIACQSQEDGHDDYPDSGALACWAERILKKEAMPDVVSSSAGGGRGIRGQQGVGSGQASSGMGRGRSRYMRGR